MATMNKPVGQHDLPKTYLRRFSIDPSNRKLKSFVFCYWTSIHGAKIEQVSIDSKKFKIDDFYTINNLEEPYIFETTFRDIIEPLYNKIMLEIERESNLTIECRQNLMVWLFMNKYRNKANRDNIERITNFIIETSYSMEHGKDKFMSLKEGAKIFSKRKAKEFQLQSLMKEELMMEFDKGLGTKHWIILKSKKDNPFLTNDNPGFSVNIDMATPDMGTLSNFYATNSKASNYFVLSPRYCLMISPYWTGTPLETSIQNQTIEFKTTNDKHIEFINSCTKLTSSKYLISNQRRQLEKQAEGAF